MIATREFESSIAGKPIEREYGRIVQEHIKTLVAPTKDKMPNRVLIASFSLESEVPSLSDARLRLVHYWPAAHILTQTCVQYGEIVQEPNGLLKLDPYESPLVICETEILDPIEWYELSGLLSKVLLEITKRAWNEEKLPLPRHRLTGHLLV